MYDQRNMNYYYYCVPWNLQFPCMCVGVCVRECVRVCVLTYYNTPCPHRRTLFTRLTNKSRACRIKRIFARHNHVIVFWSRWCTRDDRKNTTRPTLFGYYMSYNNIHIIYIMSSVINNTIRWRSIDITALVVSFLFLFLNIIIK